MSDTALNIDNPRGQLEHYCRVDTELTCIGEDKSKKKARVKATKKVLERYAELRNLPRSKLLEMRPSLDTSDGVSPKPLKMDEDLVLSTTHKNVVVLDGTFLSRHRFEGNSLACEDGANICFLPNGERERGIDKYRVFKVDDRHVDRWISRFCDINRQSWCNSGTSVKLYTDDIILEYVAPLLTQQGVSVEVISPTAGTNVSKKRTREQAVDERHSKKKSKKMSGTYSSTPKNTQPTSKPTMFDFLKSRRSY